jgi:hypothetical protein
MKTQVLRGKIEHLGLVKVLGFVARHRETGALTVRREGVEKTLVIANGEIIFARSNQPQDRLGDLLLSQGKINESQYEEASRLIREKGFRHGRSLVEIKAISPKQLWSALDDQIRSIAYSVMPWSSGQFEFVRQDIRIKEKITLQVNIQDIIIDVVRHYSHREVFPRLYPDMGLIPKPKVLDELGLILEPYESHVLHQLDGQTSLAELSRGSDFGVEETLRVVFLLQLVGVVELLEPELTSGSVAHSALHTTVRELVERYNALFSFLHGMLADQLGHVAVSLMSKYFEEVRPQWETVFGQLSLKADGTLPLGAVQQNLFLAPIAEDQKKLMLQESLEEVLYAFLLAIKKALGTEEETRAINGVQDLQSRW